MSGSLPLRDEDTSGASQLRHVRRVGDVDEFRLTSNGLRLLFVESHVAPVCVLMVTYEVGSRHEPVGCKGASHLLEHMMFKGSVNFDRQRRSSMVDLLPALGAKVNATTWLDRTNYFDIVPSRDLELAAAIEADRMCNLLVTPADLETERAVVLNEYDQRSGDPMERFTQAVWEAAFDRHPYGMPVIGVREDIQRLSRNDLLLHYRNHYHPGNATITIVGDVERATMATIVGKHFAHIPAARQPDEAASASVFENGRRNVVVEQVEAMPALLWAYRTAEGVDPDSEAIELLGLILAGGRLSRLQRRLVAAGLASHVSPRVSRLREAGLLEIHVLLGVDVDFERVEQALLEVIAEVREEGVSEQELDRVRSQARNGLLTSRDGPLAIAMQINEAIAAGDWTIYPTAVDRISSVSTSDIRRVARRCLTDDALTTGRLVPKASSS